MGGREGALEPGQGRRGRGQLRQLQGQLRAAQRCPWPKGTAAQATGPGP